MRNAHLRIVWGLFAALLGGSLTGCGGDDGRVEVHQVSGKVLRGGEPAAGAMVVLHSTLPASEQKGLPIPRGIADETGSFGVTSYEPGDGAPAGEYLVSATWPEPVAGGDDPESRGDPGDRFRGRYANPETSGLRVTIEEGSNLLETFELQ